MHALVRLLQQFELPFVELAVVRTVAAIVRDPPQLPLHLRAFRMQRRDQRFHLVITQRVRTGELRAQFVDLDAGGAAVHVLLKTCAL